MTASATDFRRRSAGDIVGWSVAALIVASVHAAALAVMLPAPRETVVDPVGQSAIMIDLPADAEGTEEGIDPASMNGEELVSSSGDPTSASAEPPPAEPGDTAPSKSIPRGEGLQTKEAVAARGLTEASAQQDEPAPIEQKAPPSLDDVEVALPLPRPAAAKRTPSSGNEQPPSRTIRRAQGDVTHSGRAAAPEASVGRSGAISPAKWQSRLMAHLERRKRYPTTARARREEGTAYVRFRIDPSGNVLSVSLSQSSGHAVLDQAVLDLVRRASPVPAPPPGVSMTIVAPVRYEMR